MNLTSTTLTLLVLSSCSNNILHPTSLSYISVSSVHHHFGLCSDSIGGDIRRCCSVSNASTSDLVNCLKSKSQSNSTIWFNSAPMGVKFGTNRRNMLQRPRIELCPVTLIGCCSQWATFGTFVDIPSIQAWTTRLRQSMWPSNKFFFNFNDMPALGSNPQNSLWVVHMFLKTSRRWMRRLCMPVQTATSLLMVQCPMCAGAC